MVIDQHQLITKLQEDYKKIINLRLYNLERNANLSQQYYRRDCIEISGVPMDVLDDKIEDEVIEILKDAKVTLNRQSIKKSDIQAAHRKGKKGKVIVKVLNRKFARTALINRKNLKDNKRYGEDTKIYINDSFIPDFGYFNYLIRHARKDNKIHSFKIKNGVHHVQKEDGGNFVIIGHGQDLINIGIEVPDRQN